MKFSSNSAIFVTVATLAFFANSSHAQGCSAYQSRKTKPYVTAGGDLSLNLSGILEAKPGSKVTIYGEFTADLNRSYEYANVEFGTGESLFTLGDKTTAEMTSAGGDGCYKDSEEIEITAEKFNAMRSSMVINFQIPGDVHARCTDGHHHHTEAVIVITVQQPTMFCGNFQDVPASSGNTGGFQDIPGSTGITSCPADPVVSTERKNYKAKGEDLSLVFSNLVEAEPGTSVTIYGEFTADLNRDYEYADVELGTGEKLFTLGKKSTRDMTRTGGGGCYKDSKTIQMPAEKFNAMRSSTVFNFLIPSTVHPRCANDDAVITVTVQKPKCTISDSSANGDPHFKTWKNEHFEFHGQCDMILVKDTQFANGVGLDVQIRTKIVRFWSYIHTAAIRIGNDILEIQGSPEDSEIHYWFNFEYQAETTTIGGFPLTIRSSGSHKRFFEIDLSSKVSGQKIVLSSFKEFVSVDFKGNTADSFGNTVGMLGDYKSGKTFARDGVTVINDYNKLGNEWQLLPSDDMLFHDKAEPQFPKRCIIPEDPQGQRRRRLGESTISLEQAESACATLKDPLSIKDCVYDILATQDLDMVGAF